MEYTLYQLLWFFLIYAVAGWCTGVAFFAVRRKRFINTGFLNAPWCPVYGLGAVVFSVFLQELKGNLFFLFLGGMILSAFLTFITGFILERLIHRRWWDFTKKRLQFEGYINLPYMAVCGLAAVVCIHFTNPLAVKLLELIPALIGKAALIGLYCLLAIDLAASLAAAWRMRTRLKELDQVAEELRRVSNSFGNAITSGIEQRMVRAYPNLKEQVSKGEVSDLSAVQAGAADSVFAGGCCFYKLAGLFFLGAFLGDITETVFCYATAGVLMSRSSVVYGPFSIVWGLGCAMLTAFLYKYKNRSDRYIFLAGTVLGGAYEYICSVFTELVFGTVFWDYSAIPFNLGGRINLLYCFFWGIAAVVWLKGLYPILSSLIERIPKKAGTAGTWILIVFMAVNITLSGLALARYSERQTNPGAVQNVVTVFLDGHFPDSRMERIYPNAKLVE